MKEICRLGIKASLLPHIYKWQNYLHRKNATYNIFVVVSTVLIRVLQLQSTYSKYLTFIRVKKIDLILSINVHCLNEFFKKNISNLLNFTVFTCIYSHRIYRHFIRLNHPSFFIFSKYIKRRCSKSESSKSLWR